MNSRPQRIRERLQTFKLLISKPAAAKLIRPGYRAWMLATLLRDQNTVCFCAKSRQKTRYNAYNRSHSPLHINYIINVSPWIHNHLDTAVLPKWLICQLQWSVDMVRVKFSFALIQEGGV